MKSWNINLVLALTLWSAAWCSWSVQFWPELSSALTILFFSRVNLNSIYHKCMCPTSVNSRFPIAKRPIRVQISIWMIHKSVCGNYSRYCHKDSEEKQCYLCVYMLYGCHVKSVSLYTSRDAPCVKCSHQEEQTDSKTVPIQQHQSL